MEFRDVRRATFSIALTLVIALASQAALGQFNVLGDQRNFDASTPPVFASRIVRVPNQMHARALEILGQDDFLLITPAVLSELFLGERFDTARMLDDQATAAIAYAEKREREAAMPFFAQSKGWMLEQAEAHRAYARYTRSLSPNLFPYLLRSKVYSEGTGAFTIILERTSLRVRHGSLARNTPPLKQLPIVVFLERKIDAVSFAAHIVQ
jgi:hypothetical protein